LDYSLLSSYANCITTVVPEKDGELYDGLMSTCDINKAIDVTNANIVCWCSCGIDINNKSYVVLWKWQVQEELLSDWEDLEETESEISHISETDLSSDKGQNHTPLSQDEEGVPDVTHTLPFKVLGIAHCKSYQDHLEKACEKLGEDKNSVTACIVCELDDEQNAEAICVMIDYGEGKQRVGYIARELTKFIHPLLCSDSIINVSIGKIKFQTLWLRIGFYMSVLVTRKGEWE
jgi:hypothetical protein